MTGNELSQEEIDALMGSSINTDDYLTPEQQDALGEVGNISFGSSATALSELLRNKTEIDTPTITITNLEEVEEEFNIPYVCVKVEYTEGLTGENLLIIDMKDAAIIANLMMGGDGTNVDTENVGEMELSAVQEAMNQMMGKSATSMSLIFNKKVDISPPTIKKLDLKNNEGKEFIPNQDTLVKISFKLTVGNLINSEVMMLLKADFAIELAETLINSTKQVDTNTQIVDESSPISQPTVQTIETRPVTENTSYKQTVQPVTFSEFAPTSSHDTNNSLDLLYDIPLQVSVELGRTQRSVKEILELSNGSIIDLDRLAGEHVDILVNQKLIAKGEVVVIDENFGVRVTDILSPNDRMKKIK